MTQNEHVDAICCQPEVDDDVICVRHVGLKTIEEYAVESLSDFRDIKRMAADLLDNYC